MFVLLFYLNFYLSAIDANNTYATILTIFFCRIGTKYQCIVDDRYRDRAYIRWRTRALLMTCVAMCRTLVPWHPRGEKRGNLALTLMRTLSSLISLYLTHTLLTLLFSTRPLFSALTPRNYNSLQISLTQSLTLLRSLSFLSPRLTQLLS